MERSSLHRGWGIDRGGGNFRRRLRRRFELELVEQEPQLGLRLGVAGEQELAPVGCRHVDIDHLHGGERVEHAARGEPRGERMQAALERDVQATGQKRDEDVGLDPLLILMEDRSDGEIALEVLERLLDRGELQIVAPQLGGIVLGEVGAQQIAALTAARAAQLVM